MKIVVTGAPGFVGQPCCWGLFAAGDEVRAVVRSDADSLPAGVERCFIGDIGRETDWRSALAGVDAVVHLAARVHVMRERAGDPLAEFRWVNMEGTLNLARQAAQAGVCRFIFLSSIKVNGEETDNAGSAEGRKAFREDDVSVPEDIYGISKHEAEQGLWEIARQTGMEVVIIRPPLIYGPSVKGNFARLIQMVRSGIPLPLGAIDNRRSLLGLDNLIDFLILCLRHPAAANQTFLLSDGEDISTPELIRRLALAMGRSARLLPVPVSWLRLAGRLTGRLDEINRLTGSLQIDSSKARELLDWTPPFSVDEGLHRAVLKMQEENGKGLSR